MAGAQRPRLRGPTGEPAVEIVRQGRGGAVALARFFLQALAADGIEIEVHAGLEAARLWRGLLDQLEERVKIAFPPERRPAGEQLEQDGSQAVNVCGGGQSPPILGQGLFGSHVIGGADNGFRLRRLAVGGNALGQAEVGDVRLALGVQQNVARFQIPMQDAAQVGVVDRTGHQRQQLNRLARLVEVVADMLFQTAPLDQFHAEIVAALAFANFVDGDDVRMIEPGSRLGFDAKAADGVGGGQSLGQDHFQGDNAIEAALPGPVDDSHAAASDLVQEFVIAKGGRSHVGSHLASLGGGSRQQLGTVGEKLSQFPGEVGVATQPLLLVGCLATFDRFEIGRQDFVETAFLACGQAGVTRHEGYSRRVQR